MQGRTERADEVVVVERRPAAFGSATSHGHLLELVSSSGGMSRQQLLAATGMSRATLHDRLGALWRRLIYEGEPLGAVVSAVTGLRPVPLVVENDAQAAARGRGCGPGTEHAGRATGPFP